MIRLLIKSAFAASLIAGAGGFDQRAMAADESGTYYVIAAISCVEFLQRGRDEQAARARVTNPSKNIIYSVPYAISQHWIVGVVTGFNVVNPGFVSVFPNMEPDTIIELVRRECDGRPTLDLAKATLNAIYGNKSSWQRTQLAPSSPVSQTGKVR